MREGRFRKAVLPLWPTNALVGLVFVLSAMWYAAASQNNAAVYLLLFSLTAVFLVSLPHTMLNGETNVCGSGGFIADRNHKSIHCRTSRDHIEFTGFQ